MTAWAYYNEHDAFCAQWLRNLIDAGHIAPGVVDERSIVDVCPDDLKEFTQCHFFAGIAVWSLALRRAGWGDHQRIWTGSCPCQPFSGAGAGAGFDDPRHLWPYWLWLIGERRPAALVGEQVSGARARPWLDLVSADLEGLGYAFGAAALPAAGVGAPHIRERAFWMAYPVTAGQRVQRGRRVHSGRQPGAFPDHLDPARQLGDAACTRLENLSLQALEREGRRDQGRAALEPGQASGLVADALRAGRTEGRPESGRGSAAGLHVVDGLADAHGRDAGAERQQRGGQHGQQSADGRALRLVYTDRDGSRGHAGAVPRAQAPEQGEGLEHRGIADRPEPAGADCRPGPLHGFWSDADWLLCRDGKWRPVEPGTFPMASGLAARVGRLRAYGNAICTEAARAFLESALPLIPNHEARSYA